MDSFSIGELSFAQKYPFSGTAKRIVRESGFTLDGIPDQAVSVARAMVASAFSDSGFAPKIHSHREILLNHVIAFPVSKILVSLIGRYELYRKFAKMFSTAVFGYLEEETPETLVDIAQELSLRFSLSEEQGCFAEVPVAEYLGPNIEEGFLKLVNREIEGGVVFLGKNDFARFISAVAAHNLLSSLPVPVEDAPKSLRDAAKSIESDYSDSVRKQFSKSDFGKVAPESFPPCMAKIYSELSAGINVNHSARFAVATFLVSIGMEPRGVMELFRNAPNFNERTTRYQVERISGARGRSYSSPSCDKMRSYNLCVSNCPVGHPVQYYSNEVMGGKIPEAKNPAAKK